MRFIEYIFENTPLLEVSNISLNRDADKPFGESEMNDILIEMLSFKRISCAKVFIKKPEYE